MTATDRWLARMRWLRHYVLYPLVVVAGVVWIVRQAI
jgi:hypothetical protein